MLNAGSSYVHSILAFLTIQFDGKSADPQAEIRKSQSKRAGLIDYREYLSVQSGLSLSISTITYLILRGHESLIERPKGAKLCDVRCNKDHEASRLKKGKMNFVHEDTSYVRRRTPQGRSNKMKTRLPAKYVHERYKRVPTLSTQVLQSPLLFWIVIGE